MAYFDNSNKAYLDMEAERHAMKQCKKNLKVDFEVLCWKLFIIFRL